MHPFSVMVHLSINVSLALQSRGLAPRYIGLAAKYVNGRYLPAFDRFSPPMAAKTDRRGREVTVLYLAANLKLRGTSPRDLVKHDIYQ